MKLGLLPRSTASGLCRAAPHRIGMFCCRRYCSGPSLFQLGFRGLSQTLLIVATAGLFSAGCASTQKRPESTLLKQAKKDEPVQLQEGEEQPLVAPPPAYGNRVVMAEKKAQTTHF